MLDHLSVSQLDMFTRCEEQYRRRYIEGDIIPPGISARIGSGVHKAAEINSKFKMAAGSDMELDAMLDCAAESYDKALREGVFFAPGEIPGARIFRQMTDLRPKLPYSYMPFLFEVKP